jgi:thiol-disulfide isomerase/thioredoxin
MNKRHVLKRLLTLAFLGASQLVFGAETGSAIPACLVSPIGETQTEDLQRYKGQVLYVDFWASWCGPCAKSFPFLNELHQQFKDQGLQIVGVNLDEVADDAKAFLVKNPASFAVRADATKQCAKDFDVKAMPTSYIVDRKGMIHHVHLGFRPGDAEDLRALVEKLLGEKVAGL